MTNDSKSDSKKKSRYQLGCITAVGSVLLLLSGLQFLVVLVISSLTPDAAPNTPPVTLQYYLCCPLPLLLIGGVLFFIGFKSVKCITGSHQWSEWSYIISDREPIANSCEMERMCNYCQKHETRQQQPHSWNEWTYISDGSCDQERSCNLCQVKESRKANHDWEDWKYKPNSCEQGRECKHCHKRDTKAAVHDWGEWSIPPNSCTQERECKHCHQRDIKMEIKTTNSTKKLSEIIADFVEKSMKGEKQPPQLWLLMKGESQARMFITEYATPAESIFAKSPEIVNLPDGKAVSCFTLISANDIRKLVDILTSSVTIECSGFVVQLPESDCSYLLQKLGSLGQGVNIGDVLSF